jgi:hypothetical protein
MKQRGYHTQAIKRHYGGTLRGLAHTQLFKQRGLFGVKLGPANRGRRLDAARRNCVPGCSRALVACIKGDCYYRATERVPGSIMPRKC